MSHTTLHRFLPALCVGALLLSSCTVPLHQLSSSEKQADMLWLFSKIEENYSFLSYKEAQFGFKYPDLKEKYLKAATESASNEEFYAAVHRFMSEFRDGHTVATFGDAGLPGYARIAHLGFVGKRKGEAIWVTELLPTNAADSKYPLMVGDEIKLIDGKTPRAFVQEQITPMRNVGNDESNFTLNASGLFQRISFTNGLPQLPSAQLLVTRDKIDQDITLPWVTKDLFDYAQSQAAAKKAAAPAPAKTASRERDSAFFFDLANQLLSGNSEILRALGMEAGSELRDPASAKMFFLNTNPVSAEDLPRHIAHKAIAAMNKQAGIEPIEPAEDKAALEDFKKQRTIPAHAVMVNPGVFPIYFALEKEKDKDGKETGKSKHIAYMYLDTFSPSPLEDSVIDRLKKSFVALQKNGIQDLVIDMIGNGGGSVGLGMRIAQLLSPVALEMPMIRIQNNEGYLSSFLSRSRNAKSEAEQEVAKRIFDEIWKDRRDGVRLSRPMRIDESLFVYPGTKKLDFMTPNRDLAGKFNIVLLVDEMCASMCDFFTAMLKDNGMAKIIGAKTMGLGGDVASFQGAANSGMQVRLAQSMLLRKDGTPLENNGIDPDIALVVSESVKEKYDPVRNKAIEELLK